MHLKRMFQRLNIKTVAALLASAVVLVSVISYISVLKNTAYVVYAEGDAVCSVENKHVLDEALVLLEKMQNQLGADEKAELSVEAVKEITDISKMEASELADLLYGRYCREYVRAYKVSLGKITIGTLSTYSDAQRLVDSLYEHITDKVLDNEDGAESVELTTDFVINSVICLRSSVMDADDILRVVLNDGSYITAPDAPTGDRVMANGSLNLIFADKDYIFGMIKNEEETALPDFDFSFNMGELNSAIQYVTYSTEKYSQMLPYDTVFIETDELYVGESRVEHEGENGIAENVYEVAFIDGKEVSRKLVSSIVITEPIDRVEYVGTKEHPSPAPTGSFIWPLQQKFVMTSKFGINREGLDASGERHLGIDLAGVPRNTPIYAADGGTVVFAGTNGTYGKLVRIRHENGVETYYAHMNFISVNVGDQVFQGQQIGGVGATGRVTGTHLHFEVRFNGTVVNPEKYLPAERPQ